MKRRLARWITGMDYDHPNRPADAEIEAMLRRLARYEGPPPGLADRIFEASVELLPGRRPRRARVVHLEPVSLVSVWGRLAMAASIGLAFFAASRVLPIARPKPPLSPEVELVLLEYAGASASEAGGFPGAFEDARFGQVEHLLVTRDMSFNDLASDLATLAADLEM